MPCFCQCLLRVAVGDWMYRYLGKLQLLRMLSCILQLLGNEQLAGWAPLQHTIERILHNSVDLELTEVGPRRTP